jgi:hypothetical protein
VSILSVKDIAYIPASEAVPGVLADPGEVVERLSPFSVAVRLHSIYGHAE